MKTSYIFDIDKTSLPLQNVQEKDVVNTTAIFASTTQHATVNDTAGHVVILPVIHDPVRPHHHRDDVVHATVSVP